MQDGVNSTLSTVASPGAVRAVAGNTVDLCAGAYESMGVSRVRDKVHVHVYMLMHGVAISQLLHNYTNAAPDRCRPEE